MVRLAHQPCERRNDDEKESEKAKIVEVTENRRLLQQDVIKELQSVPAGAGKGDAILRQRRVEFRQERSRKRTESRHLGRHPVLMELFPARQQRGDRGNPQAAAVSTSSMTALAITAIAINQRPTTTDRSGRECSVGIYKTIL